MILVGVDASKGYADFAFVDERGQLLSRLRLDDTRSGRDRLREELAALGGLQEKFVFGVESSGGVEKNWLREFRDLRVDGFSTLAHQLNPLVIKRAAELELHRRKTDAKDALVIAGYLRFHHPELREFSHEDGELRMLAQGLQGEVVSGSSRRNQLQSLLVHVHPDLVPHCRRGIPKWALHLLSLYPTARELAAASVGALTRIPHVTPDRARKLLAQAQQSVAGSASEGIGVLVREKAQSILEQEERIKRLERYLEVRFAADPNYKLLLSIRGVGPRTALWLRVLYGDFTSFRNAKAAVAYAGLDPMVEQSGDSVRKNRISKRGKGALRAVLFMGAKAAAGVEGPIRDFYLRLMSRGKGYNTAVVACMAKIVRIAYACVLSKTPYDMAVHARTVERAAQHRLAKEQPATSTCTAAPVSRKEALRRKRAAAPNEVKPQKAGSTAQPARSG